MSESSRISLGERPFVTMNVAASIDGKIAPVGGGKVNFGSVEDRALMEELRARADGVVIGGGTLRSEDPPLIIRDPEVRGRRLVTKGKPHPLNITVSTGLTDGLAESRRRRNSSSRPNGPLPRCARPPAGSHAWRSSPSMRRVAST